MTRARHRPTGVRERRHGDGRAVRRHRVDLAARRGGDRRRIAAAPLDDRVLQLAAPGRAAHRPAQRDLRRAARGARRSPTMPPRRRAGELMAPGQAAHRGGRRRPVLAKRAPRLGVQGAAGAHRRRAQVRRAALRRRDVAASSSASTWARSTWSIQVEAPPSVAAAGLQRVGRAGHQVGEVSRAALFPKHRADLLHTAIVTERMLAGQIETIAVPPNPLDILAQQTVAAARARADRRRGVVRDRPAQRAVPHAAPHRRTRRRSTCSPGATRPTSSPSCARASSGTATPAPSPGGPARSASR